MSVKMSKRLSQEASLNEKREKFEKAKALIEMKSALINLKSAWTRCVNAFSNIFIDCNDYIKGDEYSLDEYPFDMSFNEINVAGWADASIEKIEKALVAYHTEKPKPHVLSDADFEQLLARYNNAKAESKRLQSIGNPECRFEFGRALALEGVLRLLGCFDYDEIGREYWLNNEKTEQGDCSTCSHYYDCNSTNCDEGYSYEPH